MRVYRWLWLAAVAGCYHPSPPSGAPCNTSRECPDGLTCGPDGRCGGDGTTADGAVDAPPPGDGPLGDGRGAIDAGVDATIDPIDAGGSGSGDPLQVHATVGFVQVGPTGALTNILDPSALDVWLADGSTPDVTPLPDGSITFERASPTQGYGIQFYDVEIDGNTPSLTFLPPVYGRPGLEPPESESDISVSLGHGNITGGTTTLFATGQRSELDQGDDPFEFTVDWEDAYGYNGASSGLLDASAGDTLWFLHYADDSGDHAWIDAAIGSAVTQADGQSVTVNGSFVPQTLQCARIAGSVVEDATRLNTIVDDGDQVTPYAVVGSQPAAAKVVGSVFGVGWGPITDDGTVDIQYSEPFPDEDVLAYIDSELDVTHRVNPNNPGQTTTFDAEIVSQVVLSPGTHACNAASVITLPPVASIPTSFSVNGTTLTGDDQSFHITAGAMIPLGFTVDDGGTADTYTVDLFDVTNGNVDYVGTLVAATPSWALPRSDFTTNHTYQMIGYALRGWRGAAQGDFYTLTRPYSYSQIPSRTFIIK